MNGQATQNRNYRFLTGLVMGGVVGAGLTMLLAPRAATEIKARAIDSAKHLGDAATERYRDARHCVTDAVDGLTRKGKGFATVCVTPWCAPPRRSSLARRASSGTRSTPRPTRSPRSDGRRHRLSLASLDRRAAEGLGRARRVDVCRRTARKRKETISADRF